MLDDEKDLFRDSLSGITRLPPSDKVHHRKKPPKAKRITQPTFEDDQLSMIDSPPCEEVAPDDSLYFYRAGVQPKQLRDLRQGKLPIEAELDLHGYTRDAAEEALLNFIKTAVKQHKRLIHVIHGKGQTSQTPLPILKNLVNQRLRMFNDVLAFCSAPPHQGGKGAVNIILKRNKHDELIR
jgi:DNA-nicking Smr family endonuclease